MGGWWGRLRGNKWGWLRRMKIFVRKWMPGLQEMMLQKQSEHKMSTCDRVGRREELLTFHTEDRVRGWRESMLLVSRTGHWFKEILFGNFTSCDHKGPLQQFLLCQPAGFVDGHWVDTKAALKNRNNSWRGNDRLTSYHQNEGRNKHPHPVDLSEDVVAGPL